MSQQRKQKFRGSASPLRSREPIFIRLCSTFVDNLTLILRIGFVFGVAFLVHTIADEFRATPQSSAAQIAEQSATEQSEAPELVTEKEESLLSDRVKLARDCTYREFREAHYEECVESDSAIWHNPNGSGSVTRESPVRYALLNDQFVPASTAHTADVLLLMAANHP